MALSGRLEHADENVRCAAVRAIARIAEKGNPAAIKALAERLEDADDDVRSASLQPRSILLTAFVS